MQNHEAFCARLLEDAEGARAAREMGQCAFLLGVPEIRNPFNHDRDPRLARDWSDGWFNASRTLKHSLKNSNR